MHFASRPDPDPEQQLENSQKTSDQSYSAVETLFRGISCVRSDVCVPFGEGSGDTAGEMMVMDLVHVCGHQFGGDKR